MRFTLPLAGLVTLSIFDLQGRRTALVCDKQEWSAGAHEVIVDTAGWRMGCYIYKLEAAGLTATRKLLVLR